MRPRSVGLCIVLSIITCGIYGFYWLYCLNEDVNEITERPGTSGGLVVVFSLITCGIYSLYWYYKMGDKLDRARQEQGVLPRMPAVLDLEMAVFRLGIVSLALMQNEVNHYIPGGDLEN